MTVPEGWAVHPISDLLAWDAPGEWGEPSEDGKGTGVLRSTNVTDSGTLDLSNVAIRVIPEIKLTAKTLQAGDVLLERSGGGPNKPVGRVVAFDASDGPYLYSNFMQCLRADPGVTDHRFMFYLLWDLHRRGVTRVLQQATTGIRNLQYRDYVGWKVLLPPLPEQRKIAAILSSVDDAIAATEAVIEQTRIVKQGLLQDLLTKGIGHTRFKQTPIGEVPEAWEVVRLEELAHQSRNSFVIGPFGSNLVMADYRESGVPVVFVRDVKPSEFNWISDVFISDEKARELSAHDVRPGDVVITKMGAPPGLAALYASDMSNGIVTADIIRIRPDRRRVAPSFLVNALNSSETKVQVRAITGGQTRPKLTLRDYRRVRVPLPSSAEQVSISDMLSTVDTLVRASEQNLVRKAQLKSGLLQDLLTGTVRVTP